MRYIGSSTPYTIRREITNRLLHKFYNYWGDDLDGIIKKCIEKYPDENDFDLATYMCKELLNKRNK